MTTSGVSRDRSFSCRQAGAGERERGARGGGGGGGRGPETVTSVACVCGLWPRNTMQFSQLRRCSGEPNWQSGKSGDSCRVRQLSRQVRFWVSLFFFFFLLFFFLYIYIFLLNQN